ncbi:molybdopterin-guanine dinucleotide biosynthesis protein B [Beijerinckia sp. L45]|uniref:molybdopterin-guanine dinucleotide biosynthesis protein B n=1 Tax=Beijerinckia sp. L45 TaxID=1641855 RepID=UPI00131CB352|nr:molybdopterin-guanine dinucleotide biosynthesis protein B [Beijerinckia sp. L45]
MKVIGLSGWSGAGKTTLIVKLIPVLKARGLSVSTIKHAHHNFDVDKPGKDSFEHRQSGAQEVLISSANRWALMHELRGDPEPDLDGLLQHLSLVDLVLVEGFKHDRHAKIEIHRVGNGKPFLFPDDPSIAALVSDAPPPFITLPTAYLDDVASVADLIVAQALPVAETRDRLAHGIEAQRSKV